MTRKSIEVEGFSHGNLPIPAASRVGPLLMTGGIHGLDLSGAEPGDASAQAKRMFANLKMIVEAGGASLEEIARVTVYVKTQEVRSAINDEWIAAFPDKDSRPARHTILNEQLPGPMLIQCDAAAFIEEKRRG